MIRNLAEETVVLNERFKHHGFIRIQRGPIGYNVFVEIRHCVESISSEIIKPHGFHIKWAWQTSGYLFGENWNLLDF